MRAVDAEWIAIDFETTGVVGDWPDEPWQIGMAPIRAGRVVMDEAYVSLLRVGERPFHPSAPGRHQALAAELAAAPRLVDCWPEVRGWWVGRPMVAHNAATERKIVRRTAPLHRVGPWIDTLTLARAAYPEEPSHALEALLERLGLLADVAALCPGRGPHDALFDAVGCGRLLLHLLAQPGWEQATVAGLAAARPGASYRAARRRSGRGR